MDSQYIHDTQYEVLWVAKYETGRLTNPPVPTQLGCMYSLSWKHKQRMLHVTNRKSILCGVKSTFNIWCADCDSNSSVLTSSRRPSPVRHPHRLRRSVNGDYWKPQEIMLYDTGRNPNDLVSKLHSPSENYRIYAQILLCFACHIPSGRYKLRVRVGSRSSALYWTNGSTCLGGMRLWDKGSCIRVVANPGVCDVMASVTNQGPSQGQMLLLLCFRPQIWNIVSRSRVSKACHGMGGAGGRTELGNKLVT